MTAGRPAAPLILWTILALLEAGGCSPSAVLDVRYPPATVMTPPMRAVAQARRVVLRPVADQRVDSSRVGPVSKNGDPLVTRRPVTDIVRDALAVELTKAGYSVVAELGDVVVTPHVEEFWIDVVNGYKTTLYVGRAVIALAVNDGASGSEVFTRRYVAISRREVDQDSQAAARDALETALVRALHDLVTDPTLPIALGPPSDRPSS